jgi:uncharacterized protein
MNFKELGFPYPDDLLMTMKGGSQLHGGTGPDSKGDTDWYGVFIPPPEKVMGIDEYEHFVSQPGTGTDICLYSLQKWARLATKGNPSVLSFIFCNAERTSEGWNYILKRRDAFLAKSHIGAFLGYANEQLRRMYGTQGQKNCHRTFLEQQFGYDTKYAMHIIRLLHECKELLDTGKITFPNPHAQTMRDIRAGKWPMHRVQQEAQELEEIIINVSKLKSPLPDTIDRKEVSRIVSATYMGYYTQ